LEIKKTIIKLLKGRIIVVVASPEQAQIAERYGANALIVLEHRTYDIKKAVFGNIARGADPGVIRNIMNFVNLPIIGRVRFGHQMEAKVAQACGVVAIEENASIGRSSDRCIKNKSSFLVPFISSVNNLLDVLTSIHHGALMLTTACISSSTTGYSNEDTPNIYSATTAYSNIYNKLLEMKTSTKGEKLKYLKPENKHLLPLLNNLISLEHLPVPLFAQGGIMMPTDVAMMLELGFDGVILSNQIFYSSKPEMRMRSLVLAMMHYKDPDKMAYIAEDVG
ncbi:hypothetical protein COEREDRAFT_36354, partial [Coemansia reversa NRRL 1564]